MIKNVFKSITAAVLVLSFMVGCATNGAAPSSSTVGVAAEKPSTWIADRHIVIRTFNEDLAQGPSDPLNNPVTKRIKELTGITYEVQYTSGVGSLESLTTAIASGSMPDVIIYYLDNSARPEFPVVHKAAAEGVFTDLAPLLKQTKIYSKYYDSTYMPVDSLKNIVQAEEFSGATYHVPMEIEREIGSEESYGRDGAFIQKSIIEQLGINTWEVNTSEELYELAVKIKAAGFKDSYGNAITPLGPDYWGGANRMPLNYINDMLVGRYSDSFAYLNGELVHEIETPYLMQQIMFVRKLVKEGLLHKEAMTMEQNRSKEGAHSYAWGTVANTSNGQSLFNECDYLPFALNNLDNQYIDYQKGKDQYGAWSIPTTTKNPEEIVKFADFMASREGKLLWKYGIEGEHYNMVDGQPVPTEEMMNKYIEGDREYFKELNIYADIGSQWGMVFGETDIDYLSDYGEVMYGVRTHPELIAKKKELFEHGKKEHPFEKVVIRDGFTPTSYVNQFVKGEELRPLLDVNAYQEMTVSAVFAKTDAEAQKIVDEYLKLMNRAGLQEFKEYLKELEKTDGQMLYIMEYSNSL